MRGLKNIAIVVAMLLFVSYALMAQKAKKENGIDPKENWSDVDLAEMFVEYIKIQYRGRSVFLYSFVRGLQPLPSCVL